MISCSTLTATLWLTRCTPCNNSLCGRYVANGQYCMRNLIYDDNSNRDVVWPDQVCSSSTSVHTDAHFNYWNKIYYYSPFLAASKSFAHRVCVRTWNIPPSHSVSPVRWANHQGFIIISYDDRARHQNRTNKQRRRLAARMLWSICVPAQQKCFYRVFCSCVPTTGRFYFLSSIQQYIYEKSHNDKKCSTIHEFVSCKCTRYRIVICIPMQLNCRHLPWHRNCLTMTLCQ